MKYRFRPFSHKHCEELYLTIPELSDNFWPETPSLANSIKGGMTPASFYTGRVASGIYAIHIALTAIRDIDQIFLFTGRKLLRDIISLKKGGRYERIFYQSVAGIIPRYHTEYHPVQNLFVTFCTVDPGAIRMDSCYAKADGDATAVYLCGDSTVTDQSAKIPYHPGVGYASWGQALPMFLGGRAAVENQAHCGLTTESFRTEGHMDIVKQFFKPHDFCLIQFGHNDQKLDRLLADREYPINLKRYVEEIRALGGTPVLVTPPGRNLWNADGSYRELLAEHVQAVKDVGTGTDTAVIDLHAFSVSFFKQHGLKSSCGYFYPEDYTHTNDYGAAYSLPASPRGFTGCFPTYFLSSPDRQILHLPIICGIR